MLVLKLGGSLAETGQLSTMIGAVAAATVPIVIVPGGGPFADAMRAAQPVLAVPDATAHRLALLAMHQMAIVIAAMSERVGPASTTAQIERLIAEARIPVWLPYDLQHDDASLPANWTVTSDALAARLAERMGRASVALVKSCLIPNGASLSSLAAAGIVDPQFPVVVERARLNWRIFGRGDEIAFHKSLHEPQKMARIWQD